jgi:ribosomal protein S2
MFLQGQIEKKNRFKTLILENCLIFGQHPKFTNKKTVKYLLGTRKELEVFKIKELEHILLKIYPLIYTLFKSVRKSLKFEPQPFKWQPFKKRKPKKTLRPEKQTVPNFPLLFATTTDAYSNIIKSAAASCQMFTYHNNIRSLQNISSTPFQQEVTKKTNKIQSEFFSKRLFLKKNYTENNINEITQRANQAYKKPSLIVIPDVEKSRNLIKGIHHIGVPIIGLVNSHTTYSIDYPLFGNANSIHVVHFFCHLLAKLVLKATNNTQRLQVLPTFFNKTKDNIKISPKQRQKKYHFYGASCKYKTSKTYKRHKTLKNNYSKYDPANRRRPKPLFYSFLRFKRARFWARAVNLKFIEIQHKKIRVLLKLIQKLTEKQFLNVFSQFAWILRSTYFTFLNPQASLLKTQKTLITKKTNQLVNKLSIFFQVGRSKYNYTHSKLVAEQNWEQSQQRYDTINSSTYYWRNASFYRELPWFFLRDRFLKEKEITPFTKKNRRRFERWRRAAKKYRKYRAKKHLHKKGVVENIKTVYSLVDIKTQIKHKIKKMVIKARIKSGADQIKKWRLKRRLQLKHRV